MSAARIELIATGDELLNGSIVDTNSPWLLAQLEAAGPAPFGARRWFATTAASWSRRCGTRPVAATWSSSAAVWGRPPTTSPPSVPPKPRRSSCASTTGSTPPSKRECAHGAGGQPQQSAAGNGPGRRRGHPEPPRHRADVRAADPASAFLLSPRRAARILRPGHRGAAAAADCTRQRGPSAPHHAATLLRHRRGRARSEARIAARAFPGLTIAYRTTLPENHAKLTATGPGAQSVLAQAVVEARRRLGLDCFAEDDETFSQAVGDGAPAQGRQPWPWPSPSPPGGAAALLAETPGASRYLLGGMVAYSEAAKQDLLGVPAQLLAENGAVSLEVAESMAVAGAMLACGATMRRRLHRPGRPGRAIKRWPAPRWGRS